MWKYPVITANEVSRDLWLSENRRTLETTAADRDHVDPTFVKKAAKHKRRQADGSKGKQRSGTGVSNRGPQERKESTTDRRHRESASSSSRRSQREIVDLVVQSDLDKREETPPIQNARDPAYRQ